MDLKNNYQKTTNYLKNVDWKKVAINTGYITLHLIPLVPTGLLIWQYFKPKEKRTSWKVYTGWGGWTLGAVKNMVAAGIISLTVLDTCTPSCSRNSEEDTIIKQEDKKNKLEKTLELRDYLLK